ncbi:MAG: peroxiredoxin [Phycisphaeraceae bacterium]
MNRLLTVVLGVCLVCSLLLPALAAEEAGVKVGKTAPGFKAKTQENKDATLADYKGKWLVLYFYPKDDTPGCTAEACEFTESIADFKDLNAAIVGISADSIESHLKFIAKYKLTITLLSDPQREMMKAYGAYVETEKDGKKTGKVVRSTVIVNPEGVVAFHYLTVNPRGHAKEVKAKLEELQKK